MTLKHEYLRIWGKNKMQGCLNFTFMKKTTFRIELHIKFY